jgi:hypothetical protein
MAAWVIPEGITYDAAAQTIFNAFTTPPSTTRKGHINTLVLALKAANIWTTLDALYVMAAADSQAAKINWKQPGTYNLTEVNSPTFTADQGFTGDNSGVKYLSGPNQDTLTKYLQNDASMFAWGLTQDQDGNAITGFSGNPPDQGIYARFTDDQYYINVNASGVWCIAASTDGRGFFAGDRTASNLQTAYINGVAGDTDVNASVALAALQFRVCSGTNVSNSLVGISGLGGSLGATGHADLYAALHTYMQAVAGVP